MCTINLKKLFLSVVQRIFTVLESISRRNKYPRNLYFIPLLFAMNSSFKVYTSAKPIKVSSLRVPRLVDW